MRTVSYQPGLYISSHNTRRSTVLKTPVGEPQKTHLMLPTAEGIHLVPVEAVMRAEAMSNYCTVYCHGGMKIMVSRTLKAVEALLPASAFCRIHQSHVIRISTISMLYKESLVLNDGQEIPLSRQQRPVLLERLSVLAARL